MAGALIAGVLALRRGEAWWALLLLLGLARGATWTEEPPARPPGFTAGDAEPLGEGTARLSAGNSHTPAREVRVTYGADQWRRDPGDSRGLPPLPWARWREAAVGRFDGIEDDSTRALLKALLFGDRSELEPEVVEPFTRTGTRHLLALSGLHVGLCAWLVAGPVSLLLAALLARLRCPVPAGILRALLLLVWIPFAGGGPPVVRAAFALALASIAPHLRRGADGQGERGRSVDALSLWSFALLVETLADPSSLASPSVQLSYSATFGLIVGTAPVRAALVRSLPASPELAPSPGLTSVLARKLFAGFLSAFAASVVATLATLPSVWLVFGEVAPIGIVATGVAMVPMVPLLFGGWIYLAAPALMPETLLQVGSHALFTVISLSDQLPGSPVLLPVRPPECVVPWTLLAFAWLIGKSKRGRLVAFGAGAMLLPWDLGPARLEVELLDVGHGTAVLARAPGSGAWLFDAGSRDRLGVSHAVLEVLRHWDAADLAIVTSHLHRDHVSAVPVIVERLPVRLRAGAGQGAIDLEAGRMELPCRGALEAFLLRGSPLEGNEGSRALELRFGAHSVLLAGDSEQEGLAALLERGHLGPVDILLFPHHGSATPHLASLLGRTRPGQVWISGPGEAPIAPELQRRGIPFHVTGALGPAQAAFPPDPSGNEIAPEKPPPRAE